MRLAVLRLIFAATVISALAGCAPQEPSRIEAGAPPAGVHSIFVTTYGYHTGLIVRAREIPDGAWPARLDFPAAEWLEVGWGEREYYPRENPGVLRALRALAVPSRSTLHVIPINGALTQARPENEIVELRVPEAGFTRMVAFVRQSHELDANGRGVMIPSSVRLPGRFYASPRTFHAFENCNVWVARALESAGLPVDPRAAITAEALLRQVRALSPAQPSAR